MNVNYISQVNFHPSLHGRKSFKLMNHLLFEILLTELRANYMNLRDVVLWRLVLNLVKHLSLENVIYH